MLSLCCSNTIEFKAAYNGETRTGLPFIKVLSSVNTVGSRKIKFVKFSKEQIAILIGMILGDAFLQKTGGKNARLRLEHSSKQKEYLFWKISKFPKLFQGRPKYLERKHPISGKAYKYWRHQSNSTPALGKWQRVFYPEGKKTIPANIESLLNNSLSLAVWYMDDGYYYGRDKVSYLYLGRTSKNEAVLIKNTLENNFGLVSKVLDKKNKGFVIYFSPQETLKLHRAIKEFVLPFFEYKLADSEAKSS